MKRHQTYNRNNTHEKRRSGVWVFLPYLIVFSFAGMTVRGETEKSAETDSLLTYIGRIMATADNLPQEKVYLHFDNTGYFMGEKIWFKAYVVRADNGKPTDLSKVLYVELLNPGGDVVKKRKLKIDDMGQAHGDIGLDSIYGSGFYEVRAFTRYMTNWGEAAAFSRVFPIFRKPSGNGDFHERVLDTRNYRNRLPDYRMEESESAQKINVKFYPEGGYLVKGLKSKVAFTVTGEDGRGLQTEAAVEEGDGKELCMARTGDEGRGTFEVTPGNEDICLRVEGRHGKTYAFKLPEPQEEGCVLSVNAMENDSVTVVVRAAGTFKKRLLGYTAMNNGRIWNCDTVTVGNEARWTFQKENIPDGVNQLTVFDTSGRILAERLFFICPKPQAADTIRITPKNTTLNPYGKVAMEIKTVPNTTFSISAIDVEGMNNGKEGNVKTWMLLASELKGYIRNPEYYFEADDKVHRKEADLLMLVQGWRRYDWKLMTWQKKFEMGMQPVEDRLYLFGKIGTAGRKQLPVGGINLKAVLYAGARHLDGTTVTDTAGAYAFGLPDIYGEWNTRILARVEKKKDRYLIGIDRNFSPPGRRLSPYECDSMALPRPNISFHNGDIQEEMLPAETDVRALPVIDVKAKRKYYEGAKAAWQSEKRGMYWADIFYDCDEEANRYADEGKEVPGFDDWILERNPFMKGTPGLLALPPAETTDGKVYMQSIEPDLMYKHRPIIWILNNVFYKSSGKNYTDQYGRSPSIETFPIFLDEVKSIYITENQDAYRQYIMNDNIHDVVTIFVYTRSNPQRIMEKGIRRTYFQGYNIPNTFEMNDYSFMPPMEDFRRTLYWNPEVKTDEKGEAFIEFYNNSSCREIYISAEGMTKEGKYIFY